MPKKQPNAAAMPAPVPQASTGQVNPDSFAQVERAYFLAKDRLASLLADPGSPQAEKDNAWDECDEAARIYYDAQNAIFDRNDYRVEEITKQLKERNEEIKKLLQAMKTRVEGLRLISSAIVLASRLVGIALGRIG